MYKHKQYGFTIVELLIVIVVIGILASITAFTFAGLQERAHNVTKVSTVQAVVKLILMYKGETGKFPMAPTSDDWCVTRDNNCTDYTGTKLLNSNTTLIGLLSQYGTVPESTTDDSSKTYYGITYLHTAMRTLDGVSNPVMLVYLLDGTGKSCRGVGGTISVTDTGVDGDDMTPGKNGSNNTGSNQTRCYLMFNP